MPDESTGLDVETDIDTPEAEGSEPTDSPSQAASELAKKLNVDELPADADALYALAAKRLDELRDFGRKSGEETKREMAALKAEMEMLRQQAQPRQPTRNGPPPGASDEEILNFYIDKRLSEKVDPRFGVVDNLAQHQAIQEIEAMRRKYDDFEQYEDEITAELVENPRLGLEKAYKLVTADKAEERALSKFKASVEAKKAASGTISRGGVSGVSPKDPSEDEVRSASDQSFWKRAMQLAERVHGIE